ncbi:MAG: acyl-CoA thioesterase [Oligoflexales bacterium]
MEQEKKAAKNSWVEMTEMVLPQHTNALGTVFGGVVLSWVDIAAAICAQRHAGKAVVTASMDAMHFLSPVRLGWIVSIRASVNYTSKTSCEVGVKVVSEDPISREKHHTASAYLTMVALDGHSRPTPMSGLLLETDAERRRYEEAEARRASRLELKQTLEMRRLKKFDSSEK